eukprot:CAMPEP_0115850368 /NCGR_PEP_ID=MMETSP0287-20121206/11929_1 /TAXON_ID=412157 /ORGANISM="Chrysochromulina rotalis, Strain UIO044" /LENGTH=191 /DNA_ID=CAMNT_0003304365 /DNA_START=11 /DNA_END=586 /DNA_ORIENTATION=-
MARSQAVVLLSLIGSACGWTGSGPALKLASHSAATQGTESPRHAVLAVPRSYSSTMCEYSTKVKMTAETRAPLRQARIFFLYPATVAGASIAAYVSILRLIGGQDALSDGGNLGINLGIIAAAVFGLRTDLKGRSELLEEVAIELGEAKPRSSEPTTVELDSDNADESVADALPVATKDAKKSKKRSAKKR